MAHLDLKLENIFITGEGSLKLGDMGFIEPVDSILSQWKGTREYMAPQIRQQVPYEARRADIYAMGVILHLPCFRKFPRFNNQVPILPDGIDQDLASLI